MSKINFDNELAAHNVATILTQAAIGEIDKEQIPNNVSLKVSDVYQKNAAEYAYHYKRFYEEALLRFETVLNDD